MTREELLIRIQSIEWSDIEFKEATWAERYVLTEAGIKLKQLHEHQPEENE